jgi:hypothetical protein
VLAFTQIERRITTGFHACCTDLPSEVAFTPAIRIPTLWGFVKIPGSTIKFDHATYFRFMDPTGTGWLPLYQDRTLLHELSHMAVMTDDSFWSWIPGGKARPGNPSNVAYAPDFKPTSAANDAWFVQVLQGHSASEVNETWILPYLYEKA